MSGAAPRGGSRRARPGACTSATRARRCSAWLDARSRGGAFVHAHRGSRSGAGRRRRARQALLGRSRLAGPRLGRGARSGRSVRALSAERAHGRATTPRSIGCSPSGAPFPAPARAPTSRAPPRRRTTADDEGPRYPGTCRGRDPTRCARGRRPQGRAPAIRFAGEGERIDFVDEVHGPVDGRRGGLDDFVLRRADGTAAYQLAVVVDDAAMAVDARRARRRSAALDAAPARALPRARPAGAGVRARAAGAGARRRTAGQANAPRRRSPTLRARGLARRGRGRRAGGLGRALPRRGRALSARELVAGFSLGAVGREASVSPLT